MAKKGKVYTVTDGRIQIQLTPCEEGGYLVTSPIDPALITEAENLEEAFINAYDAAQELEKARRMIAKKLKKQTSASQ